MLFPMPKNYSSSKNSPYSGISNGLSPIPPISIKVDTSMPFDTSTTIFSIADLINFFVLFIAFNFNDYVKTLRQADSLRPPELKHYY